MVSYNSSHVDRFSKHVSVPKVLVQFKRESKSYASNDNWSTVPWFTN